MKTKKNNIDKVIIEPKEVWVNLYEKGNFGLIFLTKELADKCRGTGFIRCVKFREILDGQ